MSILILTLCLSHCALSTTDIAIGVGGGVFTAIKDKPSPTRFPTGECMAKVPVLGEPSKPTH